MAFGFWLGVFVLVSVWPSVRCSDLPRGAVETECRDRYLLVTTELSFTGNEPRFEAVDDDGVHPITKQYGSECGYMVSILPLPGHAELRASYFSCHTDNQDDEVFTFSFNLITTDETGLETTYTVTATCSLPLPWSPREVSCEENYMEVSVRGDVSGLPGTKADNWTAALATAHSSATSDWQVIFQQEGQQLTPMSLSEARELGYVFHLTQGRLVFRSPYMPGSVMGSVTMVNGTLVDVVYPILVSRQRWVVIMVNLVVACSTAEGMYDGSGLVWETPTLLSPLVSGPSGLESSKIRMGVDGQLLDEPITTERGYRLEISDATVQISIPFNADGGYRNSFVMDNMYHELYVVRLYYEQIFMDDSVETRLRLHRPMKTPLLFQRLSIINQTVLEERVFTVYLGNLSYDVDLVAVKLNGHDLNILEANKTGLIITMVPQPNSTLHAYILRVPFDAIIHKLYTTEGVLQYSLDINYTLVILPQEEPYYYLASVVAQFNDVFAPVFNGVCNEKSITFQMDHKPFDYLWEVGVGPYLLTPNLAAKRGYVMQNDSQSLTLEVPLFSVGYTYKDVNLKQFRGTFEILSRVPKTLEVTSSMAQRCLFQTTELIVCSTEGVMTVVTDVTLAIPGSEPSRTSLLDSTCRPQEMDDTRVLLSFRLDTCGTRVQVDYQHVTYENEITIEQEFHSVMAPVKTRDTAFAVTVRCVYPLSGLYKLFAYRRFEADSPGIGTILTKVPVKKVFVLVSVWPSVRCSDLPRGAVETECRDRYLLVTTELSFTGNEPRFEAVDADGVHPITKQYGSECGYMVSILPLPGHAELRASYFSCHTDNQDDAVFTFSFNLITTDETGLETTYTVTATCSLPLPWSPREVSCEENYMEVSMRSDVSCLSGKTADNWTAALATAHSSATSTWQVMFQQEGQQLTPMSLSEARALGYVFHLTQGRLVFRSPYTPQSVMGSVSMVNGSLVEVVHPILFSRQRWVVMMVDWVVACSTNEGMYDGSGLVWETPTLLSPLVSGPSGLESSKIRMGVDGQLLDEPITTERGYRLEISDATVQISIPFNADGGYRNSFVMDNMYHEFYVVRLYYEQTFMDDCGVETRLRLHRPMNTPLLFQRLSIINQTVLEERVFTVYLENLSYDVDLVAVTLNGHDFTILEANKTGLVITMVPQPNSTLHAYILRVPFEDAVVHKLYSTDGVLQYSLDINYTLVILPQEEPYYYLASVVAQFNDVFAPVFNGVCNEKSITFQMDHKPFDYLWEVGVGHYLLTPNLAAKRGYVMRNDSQSLTLEVPLFSVGYTYKDVNLTQFHGTFEIISRVPKTLEVTSSLAQRCLFQTTELIVCSTDGVVTVATDVTLAIPGAEPNRTSLLDSTCRPQETDDTRALFSFGLHTCGTRVQVDHQRVTYENEITIEQEFQSVTAPFKTGNAASVVTVRCVYPLSDLYKLFAFWRFEADSPGIGTILTTVPVKTFQPTFSPTTRRPMSSRTTPNTGLTPGRKMPAIHPRAKYVKVFSWQINQHKGTT
ncbi:hypothetical protein J4Q44_G00055740 [Coregonus suidteri]|uniref:ZP domain-containing protein n=1 Tax=Coregonus suidteri TaxID=861788 RepID=A0AAN8M209_9TELE